MAESIKSIFKPKKPKKYKGDITNIICRSSWERRFCNYCDLNENITEWGSEEFWIPYYAPDGRVRRYFPDFIIKVKENTGKLKTYVIEVKPLKQTKAPKKRKRVTKSYLYECQTYAVNRQNGKQQMNGVKTEKLNLKL